MDGSVKPKRIYFMKTNAKKKEEIIIRVSLIIIIYAYSYVHTYVR